MDSRSAGKVASTSTRRIKIATGAMSYTETMLDEQDFRRHADAALEALKKSLIDAEEDGGFEVEEQNGALNVVFEEPPAKFVVTPNAPVRQVWISALSTSFKLDWSEERGEFVHPKDSLALKPLMAQLIGRHLSSEPPALS